MDNKLSSLVVLIIGAGILLASIFAETIGLGDDPGFGTQQITGTVVGVVVLAVGAWLLSRSSGNDNGGENPPDPG